MKFDDQYFSKQKFDPGQIGQLIGNAERDIKIAHKVDIPEVRFTYAYSAFLKAAIALLAHFEAKAKSVPGHHVKVIEMMSTILDNEAVEDIGNAMRTKRNLDLYSGGVELTDKDSRDYLKFTEEVLSQVKRKISK
jgi:hypothetical protein